MTRWWRDARLRLVAIFATLVVLAFVIWLWPGGFDRPSAVELAFWIVVYGVLIALIARGSRLAAALLLIVAVGFLLSATVAGSAHELARAGPIAFVAVVLAQCFVLVLLLIRRGDSAALRAERL